MVQISILGALVALGLSWWRLGSVLGRFGRVLGASWGRLKFRDGSNFGVGELWFHAQADDHEPFSCISTWAEDLPMRDKYTRTCRQVDDPHFLPSEDLRASLVRRDAADSIVQVVIPAEFWS